MIGKTAFYLNNKLPLTRFIILLSLLGINSPSFAAAFQLWEQDGGSIANYHAGYAALANDASIAFYNPAGIPRIKNQQVVVAGDSVVTDFKYRGNINVSTIDGGIPSFAVTAQGGNYALIPSLHYVAPLSERLGFGLSMVVPFGLKTNYGYNTMLRYASTKTSIMAIDVTPSLGWQVTDQFSVGAGFDMQKVYAQFNSVAALGPDTDTKSLNDAHGTGYGYHLGALYQFTPNTRLGISYHSQVVHHLKGTSKFEGPLAFMITGGITDSYSSKARTNMTLPAYTALSIYHRLSPKVAMMGSVVHTQWNTFHTLVLNNISGIEDNAQSSNIQVVLPQYYRNTLNISLGTDYYATERLILRGGIGYDQTPVQSKYRTVQLPDNNRFVFALGGHYQTTKTLGVDLGWSHLFIKEAKINPPPQVTGAQVTTVNGNVDGEGDVYGVQLTWDLT